MNSFASLVIAWQRRHGRHDLPWQGSRDAYRIWLSEVMLQQTQVATVIPYYRRFVGTFPDVARLAAAPLDEVMRLWSGLGYYSRARNLHRCAVEVMERHAGRFPTDSHTLARLPGIGRSTAAAIAVFAAGERAAILDGNVRRVLCRAFGVHGWPGERQVEARLWAIAGQVLPATDDIRAGGIEAYTQGLMDLGALVCTRTVPACARCPLAVRCVALRENAVARIPAPRPKQRARLRGCRMFAIRSERGWLVEQRPPAGIWGGLWSLPQGEVAELQGDDAAGLPTPARDESCMPGADEDLRLEAGRVAARHGLRVTDVVGLPAFVHAFTHFRLRIEPVLCRAIGADGAAAPGTAWLPDEAVAQAALPQPVKRLLRAPGAAAGTDARATAA